MLCNDLPEQTFLKLRTADSISSPRSHAPFFFNVFFFVSLEVLGASGSQDDLNDMIDGLCSVKKKEGLLPQPMG